MSEASVPSTAPTPQSIREVILAERERVLDQMRMLDGDFAVIVEAATSVATDDEHDPEGATIAFERAQVAAMRAQSVTHLAELDEALADLDSGGYGICAGCGQRIPTERLAARPRSRHCITCASKAR